MRFLILTLSMISLFIYASERDRSSSSPVLVNSKKPGAYVLRGQSACRQPNARQLVFHNNYRFSILITLIANENGDVMPSYEIVADDNGRSRVLELFAQEVSTTQIIKSNGHLTLCLVAGDISPSRYIRIPFTIEGESTTVEADKPEHFAIFNGSKD